MPVNVNLVPDDTMVKLVNMMDSPTGYKLMNGTFRRFAPRASMSVTAGEVREVSNMPGTITLFQNYLRVDNKDLATELGVSDDSFEHEYSWGKDEIVGALTTEPIEVLLDALDYAPDAIKESLVDFAVELEIPDVNRRKAIKEATGKDVTKMIEIKNAYKDDSQKEDGKPTERRAAQKQAPAKKSSGRRANTPAVDTKEEKTEEE
jgi:hypothetical protein|nr:MAG TPA_asm: Transcriptional regulator, TetR family.1, transcriptional regulator of TetR [Caudoviricetes sp.]